MPQRSLGCLLACGGAGNSSNDDADTPTTTEDRASGLGDAKEIAPASANEAINATPIKGFDDYNVAVKEIGEFTNCQVTFNSLPPTSDIAAEVVRNSMEQLVKRNGDREILVMAFDASGEALADVKYGGALIYKPTDRGIRRMDERMGMQTVEVDEGSYYVRIEDHKTAKGISPERRWYNVSIVFQHEPSVREVKAATVKQVGKLKSRGLDVNVYIYTGDKSNKITWKQIEASNGNFMAIDYVAATGELSPNWDWGSSPTPADEAKYESRTWTDATGKFSVDAVFVSYANGQVTMKREDNGELITIPLDKLSDDSKQYIRSLKK